MTQELSFSQLDIVQGLSSIFRHQLNGILKIDNGNCVRQILFRDGNALILSSNAKMELPGSFLFQKQLLSTKQYEQYLLQAADPNIRQWDLALMNLKLSPQEVVEKKLQLAELILKNISREHHAKLVFAPQNFPPTVPVLFDRKTFLEKVVQEFTQEKIFHANPKLKDESTKLSIKWNEKEFAFTQNQISIAAVLAHNSTVKEVFEASFLDKMEIYHTLILFEMMGLLIIESEEESKARIFVSALSEEEMIQRAEAESFHQKLQEHNYYRWLGIETNAKTSDIEKKYESLHQKYADPNLIKLFKDDEKNLPEEILQKINQAYEVLHREDQRREYDQFLLEGKSNEFVQQSQTQKEKQVLQQVQQMIGNDQAMEALQLLEKEIELHPSLFLLPIAYAKLAIRQKLYLDIETNQKVFRFMKRVMTMFPHHYEIFECFGLWCSKIKQDENAFRSFQKALLLNPASSSIRKHMIALDSKKAAVEILNVLNKHEKHLSYYDVLGVTPSQNSEDFHQSFRFCSKYFHPDRFFQSKDQNLTRVCKDLFKKMTVAYQTIKDPKKRKEYDVSIGLSALNVSDHESQQLFMDKFLPKTLHGRKYYDIAMKCMEKSDRNGALINLKMAIQYEPDNQLLATKISELSQTH
ncbi:MAG: DnaJ domain-containing protein [Bdellovibrionota bacterium]